MTDITKEKQSETRTNILDNVLLLALNETAFTQGLIDETIMETVRNEIMNEKKTS